MLPEALFCETFNGSSGPLSLLDTHLHFPGAEALTRQFCLENLQSPETLFDTELFHALSYCTLLNCNTFYSCLHS